MPIFFSRVMRLLGLVIGGVVVSYFLVGLLNPRTHTNQQRTLSLGKVNKLTATFQQPFQKPNESLTTAGHLPPNPDQSSRSPDQPSPKSNRSLKLQRTPEKRPVVYNHSIVKLVRQVFPLDGHPPDSLYRDFTIENPGICSRFLSLGYIIVVHSAADHFDRRNSMRETWTQPNILKGMMSQRIFLLGNSLDKEIQQNIVKENTKYGDIVQGDFIDHYRNLTLKAVMGLKWIRKNCAQADYVIKVDDDVFINIFQVKQTIFPALESNPMQVVCSVETHSPIVRKGNKMFPKWAVSKKYFPGERFYPMPFCYGYATFFSTTLANELLNVAYSTPFYRLDDVYVYGILISKIKSASWRNEGKRYFKNANAALNKFGKSSNALVGTVRSSRNMDIFWKSVLKYSN